MSSSLLTRTALGFPLHAKQLQQRLPLHLRRKASTAPPPKPRVLEKPERFNPPSHPARLRKPRAYPGPPLSENERRAQKVRQYPHMMPPEGTFSHWFLTNKSIHVWITFAVLLSLIGAIWFQDFMHNTPYLDLLPPNSMFFAHPFVFLGRWLEVYRMHVDYVSAQTDEMRKAKVDDAKKRAEYRRAHGMEQSQQEYQGGFVARWFGQSEERAPEKMKRREGGDVVGGEGYVERAGVDLAVAEAVVGPVEGSEGGKDVVDKIQGRGDSSTSKWLGIW